MLTPTEFEQAARELCPHCQRAYEMQVREEKGHALRFREDTQEWVHDFVKNNRGGDGIVFDHKFCQANALRKNRWATE